MSEVDEDGEGEDAVEPYFLRAPQRVAMSQLAFARHSESVLALERDAQVSYQRSCSCISISAHHPASGERYGNGRGCNIGQR